MKSDRRWYFMNFSFPVELFFVIPFVISLISVIVHVLLDKDKDRESNYLEEDGTFSNEQNKEPSFYYIEDLYDDECDPSHPTMYYTIYDLDLWSRWDTLHSDND